MSRKFIHQFFWICMLASIPLVFFIRPPAVHFKWVVMYGIIMFDMQFLLLFLGIAVGMSPGLASLLAQVQIFFSMFYAALLWGEMPSRWQIFGAIIAFSGIGLVATHLEGNITFIGFICVLAGAAVWALGNIITKHIGKVNIMSLVVWASFVASFPMILMALFMDGSDEIVASFARLNWQGVISILFIVYASTHIGYGIWSLLLNRYTISTVVPFSLLVPIFGILSSVLVLGEPLYAWKIWAAVLVIGGLFVNLLGAKFYKSLIGEQNSSKNVDSLGSVDVSTP